MLYGFVWLHDLHWDRGMHEGELVAKHYNVKSTAMVWNSLKMVSRVGARQSRAGRRVDDDLRATGHHPSQSIINTPLQPCFSCTTRPPTSPQHIPQQPSSNKQSRQEHITCRVAIQI
jgi:hypothetical protein